MRNEINMGQREKMLWEFVKAANTLAGYYSGNGWEASFLEHIKCRIKSEALEIAREAEMEKLRVSLELKEAKIRSLEEIINL